MHKIETFFPILILLKIIKVKNKIEKVRKITSFDKTVLLYEKVSKSEEKPRINNKLYIFEPMILPIMILDFPLLAAVIDVATSGKDVPRAIIVNPIKESEIFKIFDILIAESTVISAPYNVIAIDRIDIGNP